MPIKEEVTEEVLNGMYSYVGKVILNFYSTGNIYASLYLYVLLIELAMCKEAFICKSKANWKLIAVKFLDKTGTSKLYSLRNRLVHDPYNFTDIKYLVRLLKDLPENHISTVERLIFGFEIGIFKDIVACVEQEM